MLPGNILAVPFLALLVFSNESRPSLDEEPAPRTPSPLQPPGRWSTASWGPCSSPCGAGEERRQVSCVLEDVTATLIVAADGFCAPPKPTGVRQCYQYRAECANSWVTGDWGQCSAKCGGGQRSRMVECHADAGSTATPLLLGDAHCVNALRPDSRRACNVHPCPDGRHAWLRTSDARRPRRIRLFSKFTLRCAFPVFWTPADDRSKRKYAWYKDGQRLPAHEDKYTQTDSRGELRVKGADELDSGLYTCASLTADPQGRTHNITVRLERVPGQPDPTPPSPEGPEGDEGDDSPEDADGEAQAAQGASAGTSPPAPEGTEAQFNETTTQSPSATPTASEPDPAPMAAPFPRAKRQSEPDPPPESPGPNGAIAVVAARYDASPFADCSASCGSSGLRQRSVRCVDNETGAQLALASCEDLGPPPPPQEACNRVDCPATWQWPSWAGIKCSRACGGGAKWRQARCSQTLADGTEVTLEADGCAALGPGEERRECHRAPCRLRLREGELLQLRCDAPGATWRREGGPAPLDADKHLADNSTGTLYVFGLALSDAGVYLCDEGGDGPSGGAVWTHRFEVTVLPAKTPRRAQGDDDALVSRVCGEDGEVSPQQRPVEEPTTSASTTPTDEDAHEPADSGDAEGTPIPWHVLITPAAPSRGRILGVFS